MGKVLWHTTMSLDGFIAGPGGDMSWMAPYAGDNPTAREVIGKIGAVLIGGTTFRGDDRSPGAGTSEGRPYGGAWAGPQFVLTHHAPVTPVPDVTFVGDLHSGLAAAKSAAGDRYVAILGADTARQCLDVGLLDEVLVHIVPILLGDGVPLLCRPGGADVRLERVELTGTPKVVNLWLRVVE